MSRRPAVLGVEAGSFFYGTKPVFRAVSFLLDGARTGLVGENGAGKSTLLRCLSGELELDRGNIVRSRGLKTGFVPQETPAELDALSVRAALERALPPDLAEDEAWRVDVLLDEIGAPAGLADQAYGALSEGWRRLLLIAGAARLGDPDILILDEPTNHLDLGHIATLERWLLETFDLPFVVVSHDRDFLDAVTDRTLFLRTDGAHLFRAPFSAARAALFERDAADATRRRLEEAEIGRLRRAAARYKVWAQKNEDLNRRKNAIETRITRLERGLTPVYRARERRLELSDATIAAKTAVRIERYELPRPGGGRPLFGIERLDIGARDRIALLGPNGAGKSTFLAALSGAWRAAGGAYDPQSPLRFNPATRLGVFDQTLSAARPEVAALDFMTETRGVSREAAVRALAQAGFPPKRHAEPMVLFSAGERARLVFLRLKLEQPTLYLLDEPTNHLDIEGQEALEAQLEEAEAACVFVSHDRRFVRAAATRFLVIQGRRLVEVDDPEPAFAEEAPAPGA